MLLRSVPPECPVMLLRRVPVLLPGVSQWPRVSGMIGGCRGAPECPGCSVGCPGAPEWSGCSVGCPGAPNVPGCSLGCPVSRRFRRWRAGERLLRRGRAFASAGSSLRLPLNFSASPIVCRQKNPHIPPFKLLESGLDFVRCWSIFTFYKH